jgi:hypothetical protein
LNRASAAQHSRRVNQALKFLQQALPPAEVVRRLVRTHGVSKRQAHRYMQLAQQATVPMPIPEEKAVFTVKLPRSLIGQVRRSARQSGVAISDWVAKALERSLPTDSAHG